MPKILTTLPLIVALGLGQAAFAQDSTTKPADDAAAATDQPATGDAQTDPAADLSMGDDADQAAAAPQAYVKESFGDGDVWQLQCFPAAEGEDPCQLYQLLKDDQGTDVAEFALFRLPEGSKAVAGAMVTVPLETLLTAQLTITIDGGKGKRYPFSFCSPVGCYARIGFTQGDIDAFKRGAKATVTLVPAPAPDQKVDLPMSLSGFTAGYGATTAIQQ